MRGKGEGGERATTRRRDKRERKCGRGKESEEGRGGDEREGERSR